MFIHTLSNPEPATTVPAVPGSACPELEGTVHRFPAEVALATPDNVTPAACVGGSEDGEVVEPVTWGDGSNPIDGWFFFRGVPPL